MDSSDNLRNENHMDRSFSPYDVDSIARLSEAFKVLGDATKLRICMLLSERELPVSGIASELDLTDSAASHSLRILRNLRLVKFRRDGKMIYYSLDDDHVRELIKVGYDHILEEK
ncbi:MAG: helix-turn-helix transcriptional regulator [candidate division Zixibacteria bacterium]|nr:helix-turn-helix transcriptional regulator [candidate division Zixibacteria bacterium]NIR63525.1 helix-turn-helix transcriptional regulator [candidate division Zixibacteria bacterium]NIS17959.1 helix-turn-helix transcriptional regulator [candidate division Zixibacteria bacterium]NIS46235.1 helix-turn-helix transcriptional regulator [candidate division Zixibacteria bacterium]NIT54242.1 helix-turn-helix transcriptional regulator [candidate division Zixibacteria bacterium]